MFCVLWEFLELLQGCKGERSFRETKNHPAVGKGHRSAKSAVVERKALVTRTKPGEVNPDLGYCNPE